MPDARVQRLGFIRRKVPGDGSLGFGQGLGRLDLSRPREVVDSRQGFILASHLLKHAPGWRF
jgi:hypothetical protein